MKNWSNNTAENDQDHTMATPEFTEGGWGPGPQTPEGKQRVSEVTLVHGARKAETIFRAGGDLSTPFRNIFDQVLAEVPEARKAIEQGGLIGNQAARYVDAEVVRRIWKAALLSAENWERMAYFSGGFGRWVSKADKLGQDLQEALKAQNSNVLDYEVMLNERRRT